MPRCVTRLVFRFIHRHSPTQEDDNTTRHSTALERSALPIAVLAAACAREVVPNTVLPGTPTCGVALATASAWHETSCTLDGADVTLRFVDDTTGSPIVLVGRRDAGELYDPIPPPFDSCHVTLSAAGHEAWGRVQCSNDDVAFHACDCSGWTANESHGTIRASFEHSTPVTFSSEQARCAIDGTRVRMRIDGESGEHWSLSGTLGRGSLVDGNLTLSTPVLGSITQNIPICTATFSISDATARGHVHCEICGRHGVFDGDFEAGCDVVEH